MSDARSVDSRLLKPVIGGGFGVAVLAVVIAGALAVTQIVAVGGKAAHLYHDNLEQTQKTGALQRDMLLMRTTILQYVLSPADKRDQFRGRIKELEPAIARDIEALRAEALTPKQTTDLSDVETAIGEWYAARDAGPISKTDAGDRAGAMQAALFGQGDQHFQHAFDTTVAFGSETERTAKTADESLDAAKSHAMTLMIAATIIAVLTLATAGFLMARSATTVVERLRSRQLEEKSAVLEKALAAEREQARHDALTGALTHGAIQDVLRDLVSAGDAAAVCAVVMADVDGLKAANDTYGHRAGDVVLVAVARALSRAGATVGRYGGDEFVAVLPGTDRDAAEEYIDAVRGDLARAALTDPESGASIPVHVSFGVAIYPEEAATVADLIMLSDSAMYAAKRQRPIGAEDAAGPRPLGDERAARMVGELVPLLTSPGDINTKLRLVAHRLSVGAGYDAVDFTLFAPQPGAPLATNAFARIPADLLKAWNRRQAEDDSPEPHPLRTYLERSPRPVIIEDVTNSELVMPDQRTILAAIGLRSGLVAPLIWEDEVVGMLAVGSKGQGVLTAQDAQFVGAVATQVTAIVRMATLVEQLQAATSRLLESQAETVVMLAAAAEAHDRTTGLHLQSVRALVEALARELGHDHDEVRDLGLAAVLHDIGKVSVPDRVLSSSGKLTGDDWELMKGHTVWGGDFLGSRPGFGLAAAVARSHHERWDGGGYPDGLAGDAIPEAAAIVTVADSFDAMTHDRPYKAGRPVEDAIQEIIDGAGRQFSPRVVEALLRLRERGELPAHFEEHDEQAAA